jgi:hypothetical protein
MQYGQAQEQVTNAEFDFINGVFAFNVAKLSLARHGPSRGRPAGNIQGAVEFRPSASAPFH